MALNSAYKYLLMGEQGGSSQNDACYAGVTGLCMYYDLPGADIMSTKNYGGSVEDCYRFVSSAKIEHYLSKERPEYNQGDEAEVLVWQKTDLGFKVIVDNKYSGMLFHNEIFQPLEPGMRLHAYVKRVREDGKIDLELQKRGVKKVDDFAELLLQYIKDNDGYTPINDKTDAEQIYNTFGVSKKTFKKAVGDLYKKRLIVLEDDGIRLVKE